MYDAEPIEMTHSSQIINQLDLAGIASLKELAYWSGLHENTVRDYRDGRIKHFGQEMRFWNGVLVGLERKFDPELPPIVFSIAGSMLKGTRLGVAANLSRPIAAAALRPEQAIGQFLPLGRDLLEVMEGVQQILSDRKVDFRDDATIAEVDHKIDHAVAQLIGIRQAIGQARQNSCTGGVG